MVRARKRRNEAWTERGKERREEASGGLSEWEGREHPIEGDEQGRSEGRREQGRQGNFKGGTLRRTFLRILVLQMKNSELVYKLCIVMRRNVLVDRWMA